MIFVTVGSMLPFDRLVVAMDAWAAASGTLKVFAQIGESSYCPSHMEWEKMLAPDRFQEMLRRSSIIVAHAGMGSIISSMEIGKPIVVLPRRVEYREVTTGHQVDTAAWLIGKPGVFVSEDESTLAMAIDEALRFSSVGNGRIASTAPTRFIERIHRFLNE